jgi:hypothetical protein
MQANRDRAGQTGFRRADSAKRQTAAIIVFACKMSSVGVVSVLSRQLPAILSLARRPGRPDVLLLRMSADNGDTVSGVTLLVIHPNPRGPQGRTRERPLRTCFRSAGGKIAAPATPPTSPDRETDRRRLPAGAAQPYSPTTPAPTTTEYGGNEYGGLPVNYCVFPNMS